MIVAKTKLRKISDTCLKCKFCTDTGNIKKKPIKENGYIADPYRQKKCFLTGIEVPYVFNKAKRNWEYTKCKSCPLQEVEDDEM
jgi:hypothetical protein